MLDIVNMESKNEQTKPETSAVSIKKLGLKDQFTAKKYRTSQSLSTKRLYKLPIDKLEEFLRVNHNLDLAQTIHAIKNKQLDPLEMLDNFYTFLTEYTRPKSNKIGFSNGTIRIYITITKEFLNTNGIKIYSEDLRQRLRLPKQDDIYEEGLTKEIINRVLRASGLKLATFTLMACSGGFRMGEITQLRLSDIDFSTNPTTIQIRKDTTKTRQTRFTQITNEASLSLKDYLAKTFGWKDGDKADRFLFLLTHEEKIIKYKAQLNDPLTDKNRLHLLKAYVSKLESELKMLTPHQRYEKNVQSAKSSFEGMLRDVIKSIPDLAVKIKDNDRNQIHFHAFRAWFKTQVTDAQQSDYAEALMGHKSLKLKYYRQNHKKRLEIYRKVEPALTISDFENIEKNIVQVTENYQELKEQVKTLQNQLNILIAKNS